MRSIPNNSASGVCWTVLVLALLVLAPARADEVSWLYDVSVPVADQSSSARVEAAGSALIEMLGRVTGLASVPRNEAVRRALAAPDLYYNQFAYSREGQTTSLQLDVQFVPRAVLDLVRDAGLPIWRANRPTVVAWVVMDDGGERRILGADSEDPAIVALRERARARGLPLRLPLLDLADQLAVEPAAVWGRLSQTLIPASARYDADIVLVGRLQQRPDGVWQGAWEFWVDGDVRQRLLEAPGAEALGVAAADLVADELAGRYAVLDRGSGQLRLSVSSINGPADYADMLRYFNGLEFVEDVRVDGVAGNRVAVSLVTAARPEQLLELFRLDRRLFPDNLNGTPGSGIGLVWQRR